MLIFKVVEAELDEFFGGTASLLDDIETRLRGTPLQPISPPRRNVFLKFLVSLEDPKKVTLKDGGHLSSGNINIWPIDHGNSGNGIGIVALLAEDKFDIRVGIPSEQINDLICSLRAGHIPPLIMIEERCLDEGPWDTKNNPFLHVASIRLSTPIRTEKIDPKLQKLHEAVSSLNIRAGWLVVLVALTTAFSLWRLF